jgi:two-component system, NarL family, sensor histidine kinase DevS
MAPAKVPQDRDLIVQRDRDRIAAGLQDQVIQRIFAAGLTLQGAASVASDPQVRHRIEQAIADLDHVVQIIRDTMFGLDHPWPSHIPLDAPGATASQ